jgi:hypothetical protein
MSTATMTPWGFVKSLFTKMCFGLGLATLSYLSYSGLMAWINPAQVAPTKGACKKRYLR